MKRISGALAAALYFAFAFISFSYFGPPKWTMPIVRSDFFKEYVAPYFDPIFNPSQKGQTIAEVEQVDGSLRYRPEGALVFRRGRVAQKFVDRTFVSTGDGSQVTVELFDGSKLDLSPNSLVFLERPKGVEGQEIAASIKVLKGDLKVSRASAAKKKLMIENHLGEKALITTGAEVSATKNFHKDILIPQQVAADELDRTLASIPEDPQIEIDPEKEKADELAKQMQEVLKKIPKKIASRSPRALSRVPSSIPAENDINLAMRRLKEGRSIEARQHLANALTRRDYVSRERFTTASRFALDVILSAKLKSNNCAEAKELLQNVTRAYPGDGDTKYWVKGWTGHFLKRGCTQW